MGVAACILFSVVSCTKNNNTTTVEKDSIYYSPWIKLSMTPTDAGDTAFYQVLSASHVTQNVLSTGAVLSYIGEVGVPNAGDTAVVDLLAANGTQFLTVGQIEIDSYYVDLSYSTNAPYLYRYVVIPGSILATTSLHNLTQQQLQKMSFTEIQKAASTPLQTSSGKTFNP